MNRWKSLTILVNGVGRCVQTAERNNKNYCFMDVLRNRIRNFFCLLLYDSGSSDSEDTDEIQIDEDQSTSAIVSHAVQHYGYTISSDVREEDLAEERSKDEFTCDSCGCKFGLEGSPCSKAISIDHYKNLCVQMSELIHDWLDL